MPDIITLNGTAIENVAEFDGLTLPSGATPPLDTYTGADYAFGLRLLRTAYSGPVLRVLRNMGAGGPPGHLDEADIAFDANSISLDSSISNASSGVTATTLGEFINVGTVGGTTYSNPDSLLSTGIAGVIKWYDQSTNGLDITAASLNVTPVIHDGVVNTDINKLNGFPIANVTNLSVMTSGTYSYGTSNTIVGAFTRLGSSGNLLRYPSGVLGQAESGGTASADFGFGTTSYYQNGIEFQGSSPTRGDMYTATASMGIFSVLFGNPSSATYLRTGRSGNAGMYSFYEFMGWPNQTVSRTGVETNINDHYGIF